MRTICPVSGQKESGPFWAVVRANFTPEGRSHEEEFSQWWSQEHVPLYVRRTGFKRGTRLRAVEHPRQEGSSEHSQLAVYEVDGIQAFNDALDAGPPWGPWHESIDRYLCDWERTYYSLLTRLEIDHDRGGFWAVAKADLDPNADADSFNSWYDEVHLPEIAANPGFHRAWRLAVDPDDNDLGPRRQKFWAIYEVDSPDDFASARARRTERGIPNWDGVWNEHLSNVQMLFYERTFEIDHRGAQSIEERHDDAA